MSSISLLVHDLWNFGDLGFLQLMGAGGLEGQVGWRGRWVGGVWGHGVCPHTCAHAHTHTHAHAYMLNGCPWVNPWAFPMMSYAYTDLYACMHTWDIPAHPHQPLESVKIQ